MSFFGVSRFDNYFPYQEEIPFVRPAEDLQPSVCREHFYQTLQEYMNAVFAAEEFKKGVDIQRQSAKENLDLAQKELPDAHDKIGASLRLMELSSELRTIHLSLVTRQQHLNELYNALQIVAKQLPEELLQKMPQHPYNISNPSSFW